MLLNSWPECHTPLYYLEKIIIKIIIISTYLGGCYVPDTPQIKFYLISKYFGLMSIIYFPSGKT